MKNFKGIAILCYLSDFAISLWAYLRLTDYDEYLKSARSVTSSPDLQLQVYQIMLQSFTFALLLFLAFHFVIYLFFWKHKIYSIKYIKFYSLLAALTCLLLIYSLKAYWIVVPFIIYSLSFKSINNWLAEQKALEKRP